MFCWLGLFQGRSTIFSRLKRFKDKNYKKETQVFDFVGELYLNEKLCAQVSPFMPLVSSSQLLCMLRDEDDGVIYLLFDSDLKIWSSLRV